MDLGGLAKGGARLQKQVRTDLGCVSRTVTATGVGHDVVAHLPVEIEIDVGQVAPAGVQETVQHQAEPERIHIGDFEQVAGEGVAGRAAQSHAMALAAGIAGNVADHQKVPSQAGRLDDRQLLAQPLSGGEAVAQVAATQAPFAQAAQVRHLVEAVTQVRMRHNEIARQHVGAQLLGQGVGIT